jgi:hypothetical protein
MTATSRSAAPLFERRCPRLAEDRLDDLERETDLPFLPFASAGAEKGQATKMISRIAVVSVNGVGERNIIVYPQNIKSMLQPSMTTNIREQAQREIERIMGIKKEIRAHSRPFTCHGLLSEIKMRGQGASAFLWTSRTIGSPDLSRFKTRLKSSLP